MVPDTSQWMALLRASLDGAHADRFASATPALVEHARGSRLGRRMLALRLQGQAPGLFALRAANDSSWIQVHAAALFSGERLRGAALDLGTLAFSPALRARVERADVLNLRAAIGVARLSFSLAADPWRGAVPESVRHCATAGLARVIENPDAIGELLRQRGRVELFTHAANMHPMLAERVKLAFPPSSSGERRDGWLPPDVVTHYLAAAGESAGLSAA